MVKSYGNLLKDSNSWKSKTSPPEKESEGDDQSKAYLKVWKVNPSYKDIDKRETLLKASSLAIVGFL